VLNPFGQARDNLHAAMIASAIVNANRKPKSPPIPPSEFMYRSPDELEKRRKAKALEQFNAIAGIVDRVREHGKE
jgi:hypothetical protein